MIKKTQNNVAKEKAGKELLSKDMGPGTVNRKFTREFLGHFYYKQGRVLETATQNDLFMSLAHTVRNQLLERWLHTVENYSKPGGGRIVSYLSAEFLLGPHLENNLVNLGIYDEACKSMEDLGFVLRKIIDQEEEPGLRNGGLGSRKLPISGSALATHGRYTGRRSLTM